jgi:hypothetical protein
MNKNINLEEIFPILVSAISFNHFGQTSKSLLMDALYASLVGETMDLKAIWNVVLLPFIQRQKIVLSKLRISILRLMSLYGESDQGMIGI